MNNDHLTSEEMDTLLMNSELRNSELRERSAHLRVCGLCAAELESLQAALRDLRGAVVASAELQRRSTVMLEPAHRTPRAMWSLVAAMALLCVAGPIMLHQKTTHVAVAPARRTQVQGAVSDEQLMSDIQQDLGSSVPQAMLPLTVKEVNASGSSVTTKENE